jgi:hypothetical protein
MASLLAVLPSSSALVSPNTTEASTTRNAGGRLQCISGGWWLRHVAIDDGTYDVVVPDDDPRVELYANLCLSSSCI